MLNQPLPAAPGTYALLLQAGQEETLQVGALGKFSLHPGFYLYLGSAFGPGGLRGRLSHHLRPVSKPHWHIDSLRPVSRLLEIWYTLDPFQREHLWAQVARELPGAGVPVPHFGASDCGCIAHLFSYASLPGWDNFCQIIRGFAPDHEPNFRFIL
jgi:Uri superfamily endonuclease